MALSRHSVLSNPPSPLSSSSSLFISPPNCKVYFTHPHPHLSSPNMPGAFSQYTTSHTAPPKFARKQHQHQRTSTIHARVASVDMDRLMDRFWSFGHPPTPSPQQTPAPYSDWTYPYTSMEDDEHQYHPHPAYQAHQHGHQHHHHAHEHEHERAQEHQHQYQYQYQYQHQQQPHHNGHEHHHHHHQHYLSDTAAATHQYNQHDQQQHHHHHQHAYSPPDHNNQAPQVSTRRHEQVFVPTYDSAHGTDSHRPQSNAHNGNDSGQYTQSPYVYVHQPEPQHEQQQQQQHDERIYAASPSPSSSSYSSSSSYLHHYPSSSSSSWASSSSSSYQYPSASSSSSSWTSSSSSSSPAPATPSSSSYSSYLSLSSSSSSSSSPAPQPQPQPHPQPEPQPGPRTRTRTRKAASKSTQSYHAKAAVKCKAAAKANIFRRVVNSPLDPPTPDTCTAAAEAAAHAAASPSSSLPLPRRRRRPSPSSASAPPIPIPERKPPKNAAELAKLFQCPDGTYLHVRHYTDFPIPDEDNANSNANANSEPKVYVPDEHLHLFWRSALGKFDPPDDTRWMPMARDTGVRRSGKAVWTCTAMVMKAGHPRPRPCGHTRAKSTLIRHINDVHINIRNYRCPWNGCEESFHHRFQLETHVFSMHTFESPYECDMGCGAVFKDRAVLSKHRRHVHGKVPCAICPERFWDAAKLAEHWLKAHLGQPVPESALIDSPTTSAESCEYEDEEDVDDMDESE